MMHHMRIWIWRSKALVSIVLTFCATVSMSLANGIFCANRADAAVSGKVGLSTLDTAAGIYARHNGDTIKALFLTLRPDGTQTLESRNLADDSIYSFSDSSTPVWRLNDGLSLFFQVPVYEREFSEQTPIHTHIPV